MGDVQLQELIYLEGIKTWRTESGFDYREVMRYMLSLRRIAAFNPKLKRRSVMIFMPFPLYTARRGDGRDQTDRFTEARANWRAQYRHYPQPPQTIPAGMDRFTVIGYAIESGEMIPFSVQLSPSPGPGRSLTAHADLLRESARTHVVLLDLFADMAIYSPAGWMVQGGGCGVQPDVNPGDSWAVGLYSLDRAVKCGEDLGGGLFYLQVTGATDLTKQVKAGLSKHRVWDFQYVQHCLGIAFYDAWSKER